MKDSGGKFEGFCDEEGAWHAVHEENGATKSGHWDDRGVWKQDGNALVEEYWSDIVNERDFEWRDDASSSSPTGGQGEEDAWTEADEDD